MLIKVTVKRKGIKKNLLEGNDVQWRDHVDKSVTHVALILYPGKS